MPYGAKESGSGQSGCGDLNMTSVYFDQKMFPVAHDENSSYKKV